MCRSVPETGSSCRSEPESEGQAIYRSGPESGERDKTQERTRMWREGQDTEENQNMDEQA